VSCLAFEAIVVEPCRASIGFGGRTNIKEVNNRNQSVVVNEDNRNTWGDEKRLSSSWKVVAGREARVTAVKIEMDQRGFDLPWQIMVVLANATTPPVLVIANQRAS
jgi:hypothetical protein